MKFVFGFIALFLILAAFGQSDTLQLDEVVIKASPYTRFASGSSLKQIEISDNQRSLSDALSRESAIYFRSYGNGQLSSISFRGTSANHTSVLWHGIPANYPTLGQMDFSQWPTWMLESITIQPGSAGALFGSGSIGGAVLLDDMITTDQAPYAQFGLSVGSFGYYFAGAKTGYQTRGISGETKVMYATLENDFRYRYNGETHRQQFASSENIALQQQFSWGSKGHIWGLDGMFSRNNREVQPTKSTPENQSTLDTDNYRLALTHDFEKGKDAFNSTFAFLTNSTLFEDTSKTASRQLSLVSTYTQELDSQSAFRIGMNINRFGAVSDNYLSDFSDWQGAIFGSYERYVFDFWKTTFNLRQSFYKSNLPFTPSWINEFALSKSDESSIVLNQSVSWGFRYPTLNELHWQPGNNPDLKHEESLQFELGFEATRNLENLNLGWKTSAYHTQSKNLVYWIPVGSYSSPRNYRDVSISGIESEASLQFSGTMIDYDFGINYAYCYAENQSGSNSGRRMVYVPEHQWNSWLGLAISRTEINVNGSYTGERFTSTDNSASLHPFFLLDLQVDQRFLIGNADCTLGISAKNLLNENYEMYVSRAMPGINFQMNFIIKL